MEANTKNLVEAMVAANPHGAFDTAVAAGLLLDPHHEGPDGRKYVALPSDFRVHELQDDRRLSVRPSNRIHVDDRQSLTTYTSRFATEASIIMADYDAGTITTRLDWHPSFKKEEGIQEVGALSHAVTLKLRLSEEFERWNAIAGKLLPQEEFARFLEENSNDVGHPDAATMVEISQDFEATVGQTYKSSLRLDNGDRRMLFENESKVAAHIVVPTRFTLNIPIYNGEEPDSITALFRWRANGAGGVFLGFDWHRLDHLRRAHFATIAHAAADETGLQVIFGRA